MAKGLPYFKFTVAEWMTGDIVYEPLDVQGLFINICALYWQRDGKLSLDDIERRYKIPTALDSLLGRFIHVTDGFISISFLDEQLVERKHISKVNSANGSLGGRGNKANAKQTLSEKNPIRIRKEQEEEKEEEQKKEKNKFIPPTSSEVIEFFTAKGYTKQAAEKAFQYYDVAGWHDGNGKKVKNWKQKMTAVWFKDENKHTGAPIINGIKMVY